MEDGTPLPQKMTYWLLGLVAAGFLGWSFQVSRAVSAVEILSEKMLSVERDLEQHEDRPWHNEAGHMIRLQAEQLSRLEAILKQLNEHNNRLNNQ